MGGGALALWCCSGPGRPGDTLHSALSPGAGGCLDVRKTPLLFPTSAGIRPYLPPFIRPDSLEPVECVDPDGGCGQHREISSGSPTTGLRFSGADAQGSWWDLHTFLKPTHLVALMRQGQLCCCGCRSGGHRPEGGGCASTGSRQGSGWRLVVVAGEDLATGSLQQKLGRAAFANCHCGRFQATDVRSPT